MWLANRGPIAANNVLGEIVNQKRQEEEDDPNHEKSAIVDAAVDHLPHFLGDDSCHCVDGLEKCPETFRKIGDGNAIPRAE